MPREEYQHALDTWVKNGSNIARAANALGIGWSNMCRRLNVARQLGLKPSRSAKFSSESELLRAEIQQLQSRLRVLESQAITDQYVRHKIFKLTIGTVSPPAWLTKTGRKLDDLTGVPMFFLSDVHHGEVVRAEEIGGINHYSVAASHERIRTYIQIGCELLRDYLSAPKYDGCVLMLGGDMVSGDIHEELAQTNEIESIPAVLDLAGTLVWAIRSLADQFGRVHVPCVTGNHGRMSRKPRSKRRNHTNFDWLLYQVLALQLKDDARVTFQIADGADCLFNVYQTRYLLTHGDQYRGGDGFAGAVVPIARGDRKKRAKHSRLDRGFDVQCMGHWHQYVHTEDFVVNGSVKGYDEYAYQGNFDPQPPIQALWITHSERGMTFRMPVYLQRNQTQQRAAPWVKAA